MAQSDHHSAYLARAVAALTPEGRDRVDELLGQLAAAAAGDARVAGFAASRTAEVAAGRVDTAESPGAEVLTEQERDGLIAGFMRIRDQEALDDVSDWANAVVALLEDEAETTGTG